VWKETIEEEEVNRDSRSDFRGDHPLIGDFRGDRPLNGTTFAEISP
jgi:hypothetical protein